jgi:hypothetical protein
MLFEFIAVNREDIVTRTRKRVRRRPWPSVSSREIEHGVPLFLTQLADTLRLEATAEPFPSDAHTRRCEAVGFRPGSLGRAE